MMRYDYEFRLEAEMFAATRIVRQRAGLRATIATARMCGGVGGNSNSKARGGGMR